MMHSVHEMMCCVFVCRDKCLCICTSCWYRRRSGGRPDWSGGYHGHCDCDLGAAEQAQEEANRARYQ